MTRPREVTIMIAHSLSHLSDSSVERGLAECARRERAATAELLAYLAEFDARKLFRTHGLSSAFAFCVKILGFSEDATCKRIEVARAGRRFPEIFQRIADGSLHLTGASMLSDHLTSATAGELLAAAAHKSKSQIEQLLAERFPRADLPTRLVPLVPLPMAMAVVAQAQDAGRPAGEATATESQVVASQAVAIANLECRDPEAPQGPSPLLVPNPENSPVPERVNVLIPRPRVRPLAPERFGLQATIDQATHDDLRRAQELLRHQLPDGNVSEVLKRALRLLVQTLEKRKFGLTERPRATSRGPSANPRHIPAHVRRAVWARDAGRCTFVSESGRRCDARSGLEYDHETPFALGGTTTTGNLRLRCRTHNQLEAERTYGEGFMRQKLQVAREAREDRKRASPTPRSGSTAPS